MTPLSPAYSVRRTKVSRLKTQFVEALILRRAFNIPSTSKNVRRGHEKPLGVAGKDNLKSEIVAPSGRRCLLLQRNLRVQVPAQVPSRHDRPRATTQATLLYLYLSVCI